MNKHIQVLALGLMSIAVASCSSSEEQFVAKGVVNGASGQTIYLEEVGTGSIFALDSVELDASGAFEFKHRGSAYPMFYRLRLGNQFIPFAADSLTKVDFRANGSRFFEEYSVVEGDQFNHQIRDISLYRHRIDKQIDSLVALYNKGTITGLELNAKGDTLVRELKRTFTTRYIYVDPKSPAAYFALFQRKDGKDSYFSIDNSADSKAFAAVATAYDTYYPDAPYTPFLKTMALQAMAKARAEAKWQSTLSGQVEVEEIVFPEIKLPDSKGVEHSLVSLAEKGKVLLSFTAYSGDWSPDLVLALRRLRERMPELNIYEVSVDKDHYSFVNASRNLPWLCVHDPQGSILSSYNVQALPTLFLLSDGELKRVTDLDKL